MAGLTPEKKVQHAMAIASYARAAGDIPDIQDKAAAVILDTVPGLSHAGRRHDAILFAHSHAVNAATQNRAAQMLSIAAVPAVFAPATAPPPPRRASPATTPSPDNVSEVAPVSA